MRLVGILRFFEDLGHTDWTVEVADGFVVITGPSDAAQHSLAYTVDGTVPGVVGVRVT
jgi:hypothetical protein